MPLYEYVCDACGHRFEIIQQKFSDAPPDACPSCGKGPVVRQMSSPAIQFKGSGWYITDYAQKGKSGESSGGGKSDDAKTDTAKTDGAKTDTAKTESAAKTETTTKTDTTKSPPQS